MKLPILESRWFVVRTQPNAERLAADELRIGGFQPYLPIRRRQNFMRRQRLIRNFEEPLMRRPEERQCIICDKPFVSRLRKTRTCSHSCARHLAWQNPDMRRRHQASVKAAQSRPEVREKMRTRSRAYWADPANRQAASEIQCEMWKDTMVRGRRLVGVERAWASEDRRKEMGNQKRKAWADPEYRERVVNRMRTGKRGNGGRRLLQSPPLLR